MNDYLAGLTTIPALALGAVALYFGYGWVRGALSRWWLHPVDFSEESWETRAQHAATLFAARRVWALKLPASRLLVLRSVVGGSDYKYGTYYSDTDDIRKRAENLLLDEFDPR